MARTIDHRGVTPRRKPSRPPRKLGGVIAALLAYEVSIAESSCVSEHVNPRPPAAVARFEVGLGAGAPAEGAPPAFLDVPFPSDVYLDGTGHIAATIPGLEGYVPTGSASIEAALHKLNGFGTFSAALFRVDQPGARDDSGAIAPAEVDLSSLPGSARDCLSASSSVMLVDLDPSPDASPLLPCRAGYQDDRARGSSTRPTLAVLPSRGVVLREGHRYAAVLTPSLTAHGAPVSAAPAFAAIRDGASRGNPTEKLYGDAIDRVLSLVPDLDRSHIVALTPFTTQRITGELASARAIVEGLPPPKLLWGSADVAPMTPAVFTRAPSPVATATLDAWLGKPRKLPDGSDDPASDQPDGLAHDAILAIGTAVFESPNFLQQLPEGYSNPEHRTFARDASGAIVQNPKAPTEKIWVSIAIPNVAAPPTGYPVVVIQHGLGGDRSVLLNLANVFAKKGWVSVAIEALTFGARAANPSDTVDVTTKFPWSKTSGYSGPDGFVDANALPLALFGDLENFSAMRDQFRQSAVDFGALAKLLDDPSIDLGPLAAVQPGLKLDGSRLAYVGDSFGSIIGALVGAVDPRYRAMVLNVGGGGILTEIVSNAPTLAGYIGPLGGITFGLSDDRLNWKHPVLNLLQPVLDGADPLTYADALAREPVTVVSTGKPKSIVLVYALWDEIVANEGSEALAAAAGMPLAGPSTGPITDAPLAEVMPTSGFVSGAPNPGYTVVAVQASPGTHGNDLQAAHGKRIYTPPFVAADDGSFARLPTPFDIDEPYLGLDAMVTTFFGSAFAGEVPKVGSFPAPVRDFDGDGYPDAVDAYPLDPTRH